MDPENRNLIESQRVSPNMWPYLVCLFTWLAGLGSEGHEKRGRGKGGERAAVKHKVRRGEP